MCMSVFSRSGGTNVHIFIIYYSTLVCNLLCEQFITSVRLDLLGIIGGLGYCN